MTKTIKDQLWAAFSNIDESIRQKAVSNAAKDIMRTFGDHLLEICQKENPNSWEIRWSTQQRIEREVAEWFGATGTPEDCACVYCYNDAVTAVGGYGLDLPNYDEDEPDYGEEDDTSYKLAMFILEDFAYDVAKTIIYIMEAARKENLRASDIYIIANFPGI